MAIEFNSNPYYDDFDENKHFYRILYKPGLAVQARELTQQQTIIQNQIKRFGNHIFKDGSKISGGQIFYNNKVKYLALETSYGGNPIVLTEFLGKIITGGTSNAKAKVVHVNEAELGDPPILILEMLSGDSATTSASFSAGEVVSTEEGLSATVVASSHFGNSSIFSINEGVYYINGFFVFVSAQTITLDKFSNTPSYRVGLTLAETIVSSDEDSSLLDPARNTPNFQGEGADRHKIELVLDKKSLNFTEDIDNASAEKFIELIRIENGQIKSEVKYPIYSDIARTLARRTYDESGDYTVSPFQIAVDEDPIDNTKLKIGLEPGKAFVKGYEFETISTEYLSIDKARDTQIENNRDVVGKYGNYAIVTDMKGFFDPTQMIEVSLHNDVRSNITNATDFTNTQIGTARLRQVVYEGGTGSNLLYRFYLVDIQLNNTSSFADVQSIWNGVFSNQTAVNIDPTTGQDAGKTILFGASFNRAFFETPFQTVLTLKPNGILDTDYKTKRTFNNVTFSSGVASISVSGSDTFFGGTGALTDSIKREHYLAVVTSITNAGTTGLAVGDVIDFTATGRTITLSSGDQIAQFDLSDVGFDGIVKILCTVNLNLKSEKIKTPTTTTITSVSLTNGFGSLGIADVYKIVEIRDTGNGNVVVTSSFDLDDGQRDNFYDHASIVLKAGASVVGPFDVDVEYFQHSGNGYFSVDSYAGLAYEDIPTYQGKRLSDVLDFRPRRLDNSNDFDVGVGGLDFVLPNTNINLDIEFYLSKYVNINLLSDLRFDAQVGQSAIRPSIPETPQNAMTLYRLRIPAFTFKADDVSVTYIDNKRYTMRDIGSIEKRLDRIEYYTALSLMEKNTTDIVLTDSSGQELFKNGILVEPFKDHRIGDFNDDEYKASIDTLENRLTPEQKQEFVNLSANAVESLNHKEHDETVAIKYTEDKAIDQPLASQSMKINPFGVANWQGNMEISPETDQWVDTQTPPIYADEITGGNASLQTGKTSDWAKRDTAWKHRWYGIGGYSTMSAKDNQKLIDQYNAFGSQGNSWFGTTYDEARQNESVSDLSKTSVSGLGFLYEQIVNLAKNPVRVMEKTIGGKLTDSNFIPFIRAQDVSFKITGMKPNTQVYPFFDGVDVSSFVKPSGGNLGNPLYTDDAGEVSGTFSIPNNNSIRFRTGQRLFKLTDNANNDDIQAETIAEAIFTAQGLMQTRDNNVESTRPLKIRRASVKDNTVISDPITRDSSNAGRKTGEVYNDPIAQLFTIDNNLFKRGVFITSIDLAFKSKDKTLPVSIEIRPTVNGFPHSSKIVPFSHVSLKPNQIFTSEDGTAFTNFQFTNPVFLEGGEYALVITSNSDEYELFTAKLGENVINSNKRIVSQPYSGVLFKPQNATNWQAEKEESLTFRLNRAKFDTSVVSEIVFDSDVPTQDVFIDSCMVLNDALIPPETTYEVEYKKRDATTGVLDSDWQKMDKETIEELKSRAFLDSSITDTSFKLRVKMKTNDDAVSPLIDKQRTNLITHENLINNDITDENLAGKGLAQCKYVSKKVVLRDGFDATGIKVFVNANLPSGTDIKVYARVLSKDDSDELNKKDWIEIPRVGSTSDISSNPEQVIELDFEKLNITYDGFTDFKEWSIKVVLLSPSTTTIPKIQDFRAIAVS